MLSRAVLLLCLTIVGLLPAWSTPEWRGTEGRRLQIVLEMARSGDWMVPTLFGQPTWAKPPLHYWTLGACAEHLGVSTWTMRLPAVLLLFAAAMCAMELLRAWFGARAGWVAALGITLSPIVLSEWPSAEIDPTFASLTAMSLWFLATGVARERRWLVVISGVLGGLALLQKGPPYFLFAIGAYFVWFRRRGGRFWLHHFAPLVLLPLAYYVPLWLWHVPPSGMLAVAGDESVGRFWQHEWKHFVDIPAFWLRAIVVQVPFVFWCFWEWRGARDARMDAGDLTLRMCSGAAVTAVVLLTFFPGRPTRYILPNVLLFTFAVAPAVAHFVAQAGSVGTFARRFVHTLALVGAVGLIVLPFVPDAVRTFGYSLEYVPGVAVLGLALAAAIAPFFVRTPARLLAYCLLMPLVGAWTLGLERAQGAPEAKWAQQFAGQVLERELTARKAVEGLVTHGHVEAPLLLGAGLLPPGDESARSRPEAPWLLTETESKAESTRLPDGYDERVRLCLPKKTFVVSERVVKPR